MGILLMLASIRGLYEVEVNVWEGRWRQGIELTDDPTGMTIGFLGLGELWAVRIELWLIRDMRAIGKSKARKTKPWDMKVIYHNRRRRR
jgi:lactate dehydrogenase-like 2-hydroxyacid dehydrogenase